VGSWDRKQHTQITGLLTDTVHWDGTYMLFMGFLDNTYLLTYGVEPFLRSR
jgi:hypothetical protein